MYKSIKISNEAYKAAKALGRELEKSGELPGVHKVNMSVAVGYALERALENARKKRILRESAAVWGDMDTEKLVKDIYAGRKVSTRPEVKL